jgi:hypothetical protein
MKKVIILLFAISLAAFGQHPSESLEGKIIMMLKNKTAFSDSGKVDVQYKTGNVKIDEINRLHQSKSVTKQQLGRKTNKFIYIIQFPPGTNLKPIIDAYYETGEIEYAEPDYVGTLGGAQEVVPNDEYYYRQWGLHNDGTFPAGWAVAGCDMDMQNAWEIEQGDSSIIVGILDTGVKFDHPELAGRTWINYNEISGNLIDDDANGYIDDVKGWNFAGSNNNPVDGNGHGTNIAGIIGTNSNNFIGYSGVDWNCKLMILKGFTDGGGANISWLANAIYYAVDNGARVINMSFGYTDNSITLEDAVNYALENNVVLVACMMNENSSTVFYPAGYPGVIAVGSTDWDDTRSQPFFNGSPGSNYGSHISVVAPGNIIFSLDYLSNTNYDMFFSGTSQATANVSGVASLLLAQDPDRTPGDIKYILEATAEDMVGDPIEDTPGWDQYYGFGRVNAYYALLHSQPCLPEGISFTTQEQIDNFQTNNPGCTEIEGTVVINGDDITNLNGLDVLTSIDGGLFIGTSSWQYPGNVSLTNLNGLENLTSVGGSLRISQNEVLASLTGLNSLTFIGDSIFIRSNPALTSLSGLSNLPSIEGTMLIDSNNVLTNLSGLENITSAGGDIFISQNASLTSLSGLESVTSIGGDLWIYFNPALTSLSALESLTSIGGGLHIMVNGALTSLTGIGSLTSIGGDLSIYSNNALNSLSGLESLTSIEAYLLIGSNDALTSLSGLEGMTSIGEDLWISGNYALTSLSGLESLSSIGGNLSIGDDLNGGNPALTSLSGLESLTSIGGDLWISGNPALNSLTGLESLTSIGVTLYIVSNIALTNLTGSENIQANSIDQLVIHDNILLSECDVQSICDYIIIPGATISIQDNAPGCNSPEEVEEHCLTTVEEIKTGNGITIIPNPAKEKITISHPSLTGNSRLSIFNVSGEKVIERQPTDNETQLDISALPRGVYFVKVQDEKRVEVTKLIKQ